MKIVSFTLLALALAALPCAAQQKPSPTPEKLTSDESNSVHTYTPSQFMKEVAADPHEGMLVRLKFNGRSASLSNGPNGTKIGYLQARDMSNYYYETELGLQVQVPPAGLQWYQHIGIFSFQAYDRLAVKSYIVYGRVKVDSSGKATVRLVGTEIKHDLDGDTIDWGESSSSDPDAH